MSQLNLWKLTCSGLSGSSQRTVHAVIVALTPIAAKQLLMKSPTFNRLEGDFSQIHCKQLGVAATDLREPEIVLIQLSQ